MKWTLGFLLLAAAGCGYSQDTRMVACPETGCPQTYAKASPQGLSYRHNRETVVEPTAGEEVLRPPPLRPLPDTEPPPPAPPPVAP